MGYQRRVHGGEDNNDNRAVWSLPDSSAKSYTKEEEESRQPRKTPEENSFLQKDGSPADGFFPSGAGSWLSKTNANSPSIKCYFEQQEQFNSGKWAGGQGSGG